MAASPLRDAFKLPGPKSIGADASMEALKLSMAETQRLRAQTQPLRAEMRGLREEVWASLYKLQASNRLVGPPEALLLKLTQVEIMEEKGGHSSRKESKVLYFDSKAKILN